MSVAIVVPWRPGCPHRERAWEFVRAHLAASVPAARVIEARAPAGEWCKAAAVRPVLADLAADVVVVHDADVLVTGLPAAVEAVQDGAPWAIPHRPVVRLTEAATRLLLAGHRPNLQDCAERPYAGVEGGGCVALRADVAAAVPLDPRFTGWGQEDESWGMALHALHGAPARGRRELLHLWHPPQHRMTRKYGSPEGRALARRYRRAKNDPAQMRALLDEIATVEVAG